MVAATVRLDGLPPHESRRTGHKQRPDDGQDRQGKDEDEKADGAERSARPVGHDTGPLRRRGRKSRDSGEGRRRVFLLEAEPAPVGPPADEGRPAGPAAQEGRIPEVALLEDTAFEDEAGEGSSREAASLEAGARGARRREEGGRLPRAGRQGGETGAGEVAILEDGALEIAGYEQASDEAAGPEDATRSGSLPENGAGEVAVRDLAGREGAGTRRAHGRLHISTRRLTFLKASPTSVPRRRSIQSKRFR